MRLGEIGPVALVALLAVLVGITAGVVAMTMGARKIPVQIPRKVVGRGRIQEGQKSFIPLRVNSAGVMPIIFAQAFIVVPGTLAAFSSLPLPADAGGHLPATGPSGLLHHLWPAHRLLHLLLHRHHLQSGGSGGEPEEAGRVHSRGEARGPDRRVHRPGPDPGDAPGSIYLALIALVPFWIFDIFNIQTFFFGGTGLLIVVGVALDTVQQAQQHLMLRHYDGFMKKGG